jgi:hypothetical protein
MRAKVLFSRWNQVGCRYYDAFRIGSVFFDVTMPFLLVEFCLWAEFALPENTPQKMRQAPQRKLTVSGLNPTGGDSSTITSIPDQFSGRLEASDLAPADSALKAGKFISSFLIFYLV